MSETATGLMAEEARQTAGRRIEPARAAGSPPTGASFPEKIGAALSGAIATRTGIAPEVSVGGLVPVHSSNEAGVTMTLLARVSASGGVNGELVLLAGGALAAALAAETGEESALALFWGGARAALESGGRSTAEWIEAPPLSGTREDIVMGLAGIFLDDVPLTGVQGQVTAPESHAGEFELRVTSSLVSDVLMDAPSRRALSGERDAAPPAAAFPDFESHAAGARGANLGLMADIELELVARLGEVEMKLEDVLALSPGSILELDRSVEDPVDLVVNGRHIGRAEVVVVGEKFALRVQEIGEKRSRGHA